MGRYTTFLSAIAIILVLACYKFEGITKSEDLWTEIDNLNRDWLLVYIISAVAGFLFISFFIGRDEAPAEITKVYNKRIPIEEYEKQKKTYTELKVLELLKSKEFKRYKEAQNPLNEDNQVS
jgi:hypothetical protein